MLRIAPGRRLCWSPRWQGEEASVLFDSASGDFWVLGDQTRELLERIEASPGLSRDGMLVSGGWSAASLSEAVASLIAAEVLVPLLDPTAQNAI